VTQLPTTVQILSGFRVVERLLSFRFD